MMSAISWENVNCSIFTRRAKDIEGGNSDDVSAAAVRFQFRLIPSAYDANGNPSELATLIRRAGGVVSKKEVDYALPILDMKSLRELERGSRANFDVPNDAYASEFIYHSIQKTLHPPKKYLITPSIYESYDPLQVLLRKVEWSKLTRTREPRSYPASEIIAKLKIPSETKGVSEFVVSHLSSSSDEDLETMNRTGEPRSFPASEIIAQVNKIPSETNDASEFVASHLNLSSSSDEDPGTMNPKGKEVGSVSPKSHLKPTKTVVGSNQSEANKESDSKNVVEIDIDSDSSDEVDKPKRRRKRRIHKIFFRREEDKLIVDKMFDKQAFLYCTKGKKFWKLMANSEDFKQKRSSESLRCRWRQYLAPLLLRKDKEKLQRRFGLSGTQVEKFRRNVKKCKEMKTSAKHTVQV